MNFWSVMAARKARAGCLVIPCRKMSFCISFYRLDYNHDFRKGTDNQFNLSIILILFDCQAPLRDIGSFLSVLTGLKKHWISCCCDETSACNSTSIWLPVPLTLKPLACERKESRPTVNKSLTWIVFSAASAVCWATASIV